MSMDSKTEQQHSSTVRWSSRLAAAGRKRRRQAETETNNDNGNGNDDETDIATKTTTAASSCHRPKATASAIQQDCGILPSE